MLASINPLGERGRGTRWGRTVAWYLAGSVAGGALIGAAFGAIGAGVHALTHPSHALVAVVVVVASLLALAFDLHLGGLALPSIHRQVNEDWLTTYRGWLYGSGFGFQLGMGVMTIVNTAAYYLVLVLEVLGGSVIGGLVIGATFGLARALPILSMRRVHDPAQLRDALRRQQRFAPAAVQLARFATAALGLVGAVALIGGAA